MIFATALAERMATAGAPDAPALAAAVQILRERGTVGAALTALEAMEVAGATWRQFALVVDTVNTFINADPEDGATVALAAFALMVRAVPETSFKRIGEAEDALDRIAALHDETELAIADLEDGGPWRALTAVRAAVSLYIEEEARQLPRRREQTFAAHLPALAIAQRVYRDGSRGDEIANENDAPHPAFMPLTVNVLTR